MTSGSLFIQRPESALRHVNLLAKGLRKVAIAGWVGGVGCTLLAIFVTHNFGIRNPQGSTLPGYREVDGITAVTWFMAAALLFFSTLYFIGGWGLARQKAWARYFAAATFLLKFLLCVWIGRASVPSMIIFLLIAAWDIYGLWVLLSKETGLLFSSRVASPGATQHAA
jgi:hypothetical protein